MHQLALLALAGSSLPSDQSHYLQGEFVLSWDDHIDGTTDGSDKSVVVHFEVKNGRVVGRFASPISKDRPVAAIEGVIDGEGAGTRLFTFRQIEPGYVCHYQVTIGRGAYLGEWRDVMGRSGDVMLRRRSSLIGH